MPLRCYKRVVETGDLPLLISSNQDQTLHRAMLTGEGTRWDPEIRRRAGQDHALRELPGPAQPVFDAAALVDRVEDGLVPGRDRFLAAMVLPSNIDEVGVGGEGLAERPAVGLVPACSRRSISSRATFSAPAAVVFSSTPGIPAGLIVIHGQ